jgi:hypothetical protein
MKVVKQNIKAMVLKTILALVMIGVSVYFFTTKINKKEVLRFTIPGNKDNAYLYDKFDLDVLDDNVFKELKEVEVVDKENLPNNVGRPNPFIKL